MIFHDIEQNSPEWIKARLGIPCSSEFKKVMTAKKRQLSAQAPKLMQRLLAEWVTGTPVDEADDLEPGDRSTPYMQRGHDFEDQAVRAYEGLNDVETKRGGFWTTDDGMMGASPDRLIGDDGILELKCPGLPTQIGYILGAGVDDDYRIQLQGQMMVTGRKYVDVFSYHPRLIVPAIRVERDEEYIADLQQVLSVFIGVMLNARAKLEAEYGPFIRVDLTAQSGGDFDLTEEDVTRLYEESRKHV